MAENTPLKIMTFFSTPENRVGNREMREFWESLTEEEREYYRNADLS